MRNTEKAKSRSTASVNISLSGPSVKPENQGRTTGILPKIDKFVLRNTAGRSELDLQEAIVCIQHTTIGLWVTIGQCLVFYFAVLGCVCERRLFTTMTVKPLMGIWKIMMKRFKFKCASQLALVLTSMAMLASCGSAPTSTAPEAATEPTTAAATPADQQELKDVRVQLSFLKQSLDAPLIIAINKGYFAEEGLNVAYERGFGNSDTIGKLGTGKFDFAFSDMYNTMDFNEKIQTIRLLPLPLLKTGLPFL